MAKPFFNDSKNIISFTNENKLFRPVQVIMILKNHRIKDGLYTEFLQLMNLILHTLLSSDEGRNKSSKPNHTKNIGLVNPEDTFCL